MSVLDQLPKAPAVEAALRALNASQRAILNILFAHMFVDPFSQLCEYSLEEIIIDGARYDQIRGRFHGAFVTLLFHPNDEMHVIDLLPLANELDEYLHAAHYAAH